MANSVCSEHSGMCVNIDTLKKQTDSNSKEIRTLSEAVVKLTILVEDCNSRLKTPTAPSDRLSFWDVTTKKYTIKLGFILGLVLIFALAGTNLLTNTNILDFIK